MQRSAITTMALARLLVVAVLLFGIIAFAAGPTSAASPRVVDVVATSDGAGYWILYDDGRVVAEGAATWLGNGASSARAFSAAPDDNGYWVVTAAGRVEAFGTATGLRGVDHLALASGIIDMAPTPTGNGLWLVAGDGGIFTLGDAMFHGSTGAMNLARPVAGIAPTPSGDGYWLVARDGGIFSFGNAPFVGSMGGTRLDQDIIAIVATPTGGGYMMVGADGGVFTFGATAFHGSLGGQGRTDIVGIAPLGDGSGYYMATSAGGVYGFGRAVAATPTTPTGAETESRIEQEILQRVNSDRALRGLAPLRWDIELAATAEIWSDAMVVSGFRHSNLAVTIAGLTTVHYAAGENIYWGSGPYATSAQAHQSLMDSAGHREAILESAYTTIGIGVTCSGGRLWVTEQFGHPAQDGAVTRTGQSPRFPQVDFSGLPATSC